MRVIRHDNAKIYKLFKEIEMPIMRISANMELKGITIDTEFANKLSIKYHKQLDDIQHKIELALIDLKPKIDAWRKTAEANSVNTKKTDIDTEAVITNKPKTKNEQLSDPPKTSSPIQLAILLYDVLKLPVMDKRNPRGTGKEILKKLAPIEPFCSLLLEERNLSKLIDAFLDTLPKQILAKDGRIHANFNQLGTDCITGDSLILTKDGYTEIKDFFLEGDSEGVYIPLKKQVFNKDLSEETTKFRIKFLNVPTKKIILENGYSIEGTLNHPIICSKNLKKKLKHTNIRFDLKADWMFKELGDITTDDVVAIPINYNKFPENTHIPLNLDFKHCSQAEYTGVTECTEEFAELLGIYMSTQAIYDLNELIFPLKEDTKKYEDLCQKVFKYSVCNISSQFISFVGINLTALKNYFDIQISWEPILNLLKQANRNIWIAFLRGMELGACIKETEYSGVKLYWKFKNELICTLIQNVLLNLGIVCKKVFKRDGFLKLTICGEMYYKFLNIIHNTNTLPNPVDFSFEYLVRDNIYYAKVKKIIQNYNDVYDLHLPETHTFISNGIISHNTGRFSCTKPNLQQLPSKNDEVRMMFIPKTDYFEHEISGNNVCLSKLDDVETLNGWVKVKELKVGMQLLISDSISGKIETAIIKNIKDLDKYSIIVDFEE